MADLHGILCALMACVAKSTIPILLRGFLDKESLDQAWSEVQRAVAKARETEIVLVISSREADIGPVLDFVQRLTILGVSTAAKLYIAEGPAALIALTAPRRQIMSRGAFSLRLDPVEIEACELDENGVLTSEGHRLLKDYVQEVFASLDRLAGSSASLVCKLSARGSLQLSPAECLTSGVVERIIY